VRVADLRVPVRMPGILDGPGVALQAESFLPQQLSDGVRGNLMPRGNQLGTQRTGRLRRPTRAYSRRSTCATLLSPG